MSCHLPVLWIGTLPILLRFLYDVSVTAFVVRLHQSLILHQAKTTENACMTGKWPGEMWLGFASQISA